MEILLYILLTLMLAAVAMLTVMLVRQSKAEERIVDRLMEEMEDDQRELRMELTDSVHKNVRNLGSLIAENQQSAYRAQSESMSQLRRVMADMGTRIEQRLGTSSMENEQKLENIRGTMEKRLAAIQQDNADVVVLVNQPLGELGQLTHQVVGQGVVSLGSVQGDLQDVGLDHLEQQVLISGQRSGCGINRFHDKILHHQYLAFKRGHRTYLPTPTGPQGAG